jgi:hypothetical protein
MEGKEMIKGKKVKKKRMEERKEKKRRMEEKKEGWNENRRIEKKQVEGKMKKRG